jgi:hypothetical protein
MKKIGIFWYYQQSVIGKAVTLEEGAEGVSGIIDSPDNHVDYWEAQQGFCARFPKLMGKEYQDIPRGRVLYLVNGGKALVYLDKKLLKDIIKKRIMEFFELDAGKVQWRTDLHYTTSKKELARLFGG